RPQSDETALADPSADPAGLSDPPSEQDMTSALSDPSSDPTGVFGPPSEHDTTIHLEDPCAAAEEPYAQYATTVPLDVDVEKGEHAVLYLVNVERAKHALPALCWND